MLTKSDAFLQRKPQNTPFFGYGTCCGEEMAEETVIAGKNQQRRLKQKISMRQVGRQAKLKDFDRGSLRKACSTSVLREDTSSKNLSMISRPQTQLHFAYLSSPLSDYPKTIISYYNLPFTSLSKQASTDPLSHLQPLAIKNETSIIQVQNKDQIMPEQGLAKTVKIPSPQPNNQEAQFTAETSTNLMKIQSQSPHRRQKSQLPPKSQGFQQGLDRPRPRNFQRGTLFKSVRRSQTIDTDAKSDSSSSIVIEGYRSLMSKIQEREQQFEEI